MRPSIAIRLVTFMLVASLSSGCMALVAGGAGAVGGYALSRDTFEGTTGKGQDEIWDAAYTVASIMGTVTDYRRKRGELEAMVYGARVIITVIPVNLTTSKLRVKARKNIFPQIAIAQEVYTKIINQLEQ